MTAKTRVLVIDDEPQILRALRINLSVRGYEVITAATGAAALHAAAEHQPRRGRSSTWDCPTCPASTCSPGCAAG